MQNDYQSLKTTVERWIQSEADSWKLAEPLKSACLYSLLSPGKRLRPVLTLATAQLLEVSTELCRPFALALEFIHNASLIHDDLPCMDNDDFRRGMPTCHKQFSESLALLAGDVMIVKAFQCLEETPHEGEAASPLGYWVRLIGAATSSLCVGQVMDVDESKTASATSKTEVERLNYLETLNFCKTGALFQAVFLGPTALIQESNRREHSRELLSQVGKHFGLLFQITDDLLDADEQPEAHGKNSDGGSFVTALGKLEAQNQADLHLSECLSLLERFNADARFLREVCQMVRTRRA